MFDHLEETVKRFDDITERMFRPDLSTKEMQDMSKERARLEPLVSVYQSWKQKSQEFSENKLLIEDNDADIRSMAKEELIRLTTEIESLEQHLKILLLPRDPMDDKNIILEIRAGTGGDEASLFAGELFQMYSRYAQLMGWRVDIMSLSEGTKGGFKEVVASIEGTQVYSNLKYEAGVHRVQRVPETETQGRVHTSACTVAILPEVDDDVEIDIKTDDLRIDTLRSGGAGGQHVNKTESAVRITHLPTNTVVLCQQERSQIKNRALAMKILRARLYEKKVAEQQEKLAEERRVMVKSGDRSDKIRTYNFPQDRCTDHRVSYSAHNLPKLMAGDMEDFLSHVRSQLQAELLNQSN